MRPLMSRLLVGLLAAPVMLISSAAHAGPCASECSFLPNLTSISDCAFVVNTGSCEAQCTPPNVVAQCDAQCTGSVSVACNASFQASCEAQCQANPGSFTCSGSCTQQCTTDCASNPNCTDSACQQDCVADCTNRCDISCSAVPPTATCEASCQASLQGDCAVQDNIQCHAGCSVSVSQGGCLIDCKAPTGALFCNGQYVSVSDAASCVGCLETNGLSVTETTTCTAGGGCTTAVGCATSPSVGATDERWGVLGITGLVMGLGLVVSRRRRQS